MDVRFDDSIPAFVEFLAELGLDHVELRWGYLDVAGRPRPGELRSIAEEHDVTFTVHAPHVDVALGNLNERLREAAVDEVKAAIDFADAVNAGGVVVHGGSMRRRYPEHVNRHERAQAVESLAECVEHADRRRVPLCLENQPESGSKRRNTATPERLAAFLDDVGVDSDYCKLALDVGHANVTGVPYERFAERFGDRIHVVHLHDNDGSGDDHDPLPSYRSIVEDVGAPYNVLEMKSWADVRRCVRSDATGVASSPDRS